MQTIFIYGRIPFLEAARAMPQGIGQVYIEEHLRDDEIWATVKQLGVAPKQLTQRTAEHLVGSAVHQGIVFEFDSVFLYTKYDDVAALNAPTPDTCVVVLGGLTDPQNVGAIIRSAAALGASAILIPEHNQAPVTGAVAKASAGMVFRIPLVKIGNVNQTLRKLKEHGFWTYGLAMDGANTLSGERFTEPTVFVVGSEGEGLREKTLEHCDIALRIPMDPRAESLNASVSAALCLYEWSRQHQSILEYTKQ